MPIVIDNGAAAITGLAAYAAGRGKYRREQQRAWLPVVAQQMKFQQDMALQQQKYLFGAHAQRRGQRHERLMGEAMQDWKAGQVGEEQEFRAGEYEKERSFRVGEAETARTWRSEEADVTYARQQQSDQEQYGREQVARAQDLGEAAKVRQEESLETGRSYYSGKQQERMGQIEQEVADMDASPFFEQEAKDEFRAKKYQEYDMIRSRPHKRRADEFEKPPRGHVTESGAQFLQQPDGKWIQEREQVSPERVAAEQQRVHQEKIFEMEDALREKQYGLSQLEDKEGNLIFGGEEGTEEMGRLLAPFGDAITERRGFYGLPSPGGDTEGGDRTPGDVIRGASTRRRTSTGQLPAPPGSGRLRYDPVTGQLVPAE